MLRRILTPLDPSNYAKSALQYAIYIAKRQEKAEITGSVVLDSEDIVKSIGPVAAGALYWAEHLEKHKLEEAKIRIEKLLDMFKNTCSKENVSHKTAETQGNPAKQILDEDMNKANYYMTQAKNYLQSYQIENVKTEWTAESIHDILRDRYIEWADLIVLGAHARSYIKDIFIGSLTKYLIEKAQKPLFIGQ